MLRTSCNPTFARLCSFKPTIPDFAQMSPLLTMITVLIVSTVLFVTLKRKKRLYLTNKPIKDEKPTSELGEKKQADAVRRYEPESESDQKSVASYSFQNGASQNGSISNDAEPEAITQSESESKSSGEAVARYSFEDGECQNESISNETVCDDDDEDEESLIEIALLGGVGDDSNDLNEAQKDQEPSLNVFLFASVLGQLDLMKLSTDIIESEEEGEEEDDDDEAEENLIEIDISMGSVKPSGLEAES